MKRHEALALIDSLRLNSFNGGYAYARGNIPEFENRIRREHKIREQIIQLICNKQDEGQS